MIDEITLYGARGVVSTCGVRAPKGSERERVVLEADGATADGDGVDDDTAALPREKRVPKRSGVQERSPTPSEFPTLRPEDVRARAPLLEDPREAARDPRVAAMRDLYAAGEIEAALFIAATIDSTPPGHVSLEAETAPPPPLEPGAEDLDVLAGLDDTPTHRVPLAPLVPLDRTSRRVPCVVRTPEEIAAIPLDHRVGFLLTHVDGRSSVGEILDVCAMPESEALVLFRQLLELGVISFR